MHSYLSGPRFVTVVVVVEGAVVVAQYTNHTSETVQMVMLRV